MSTHTMNSEELFTQDSHILAEIPIEQLDDNPEFNCRGRIIPLDVRELMESIRQHGLQQPIVIHKYNDIEKAKTGKSYRVVSGYKRLAAHKGLSKNNISCIVKEWMPEANARVLNLIENLQRQDLNVVQEAKSIQHLKWAGWTLEDVAKALNKSTGWVQVRFSVLSFPEDIQQACAEGVLNQQQIKDIYSLPRDKQYEAVRLIKDKRIRGDKNIKVKKSITANTKKARDRSQVNKMLDIIMDNLEPSFATRCLAWASGEISTLDLFQDVKHQCLEQGKSFLIPDEDL